MTGERFGPYRIVGTLGRGGMGEVHEAYDTARERTVALKRLRDDLAPSDAERAVLRERFRRESRAAARLDSPHVVPIHDFGVIDDRLFLDMRLVRGTDLGALIARRGPLDPGRAVALVAQVAHALDAAHDAGLVHRDVKPSNALLTRDEDFVYLADFGIVHVRDATRGERITATGSAIGTPAYMAPEQLMARPFDHRLDVYALGCVLFEALTGRPPFVGDGMSVASQHVHAAPPPPTAVAPGLPPALDAVLLRALDKDPERRQDRAGELAGAARSALGTDERRRPPAPTRVAEAPATAASRPSPRPVSASPHEPATGGDELPATEQTATQAPRRARTGRRLGIAGIVAVVVAAVAVVLWFTTSGSDPPSVPAASVESQIVAQSGLTPAQVRCPEALPARVGASIVCTASTGGRSQPLRTTVTSVVGEQVNFTIDLE